LKERWNIVEKQKQYYDGKYLDYNLVFCLEKNKLSGQESNDENDFSMLEKIISSIKDNNPVLQKKLLQALLA